MNIYESTKWGVHIIGPDSVLAASSFHEAVEKSTQINTEVIARYAAFATENSPLFWAVIMQWPDGHGSHDPESTDWNNIV